MRKRKLLLKNGMIACCVLAVTSLIVPFAAGNIIVADDFGYPDGALVPNNGGFSQNATNQWTGAWQNSADLPAADPTKWRVSSGNVDTDPTIGFGIPNNVIDRPFTTDLPAGTTVYFGFDLKRYTGSSGTLFGMTLGIPNRGAGSQPNMTLLGITGGPSGAGATRFSMNGNIISGGVSAGTFATDVFHRFVGRIEFDAGVDAETGTMIADVMSVWANPTSEADVPLLVKPDQDMEIGNNMNGLTMGIMARDIFSDPAWAVDNMVLSTDFNSARTGIPEPATLSLLGIVMACLAVRRKVKRS